MNENAKRFSSLMSRMRARLYCIIEGSAIPDKKQDAIKRQMKDATDSLWDSAKGMIKENE